LEIKKRIFKRKKGEKALFYVFRGLIPFLWGVRKIYNPKFFYPLRGLWISFFKKKPSFLKKGPIFKKTPRFGERKKVFFGEKDESPPSPWLRFFLPEPRALKGPLRMFFWNLDYVPNFRGFCPLG
jgi:hypothetical protein